MAAPTLAHIDLSKTENCTFITTHFHMGMGRMKQIKNLEVITNADRSQLKHQKQLIDSPELEEIRSQDSKLKRFLDTMTCAYDESTRFAPNEKMETLYKAMKAYQVLRRPKLVAKFMEVYRELEASDFASLRESLGEHFHRDDYPSADAVERGFDFEFNLRPVGAVNLKGLPDYIIAEEIAKDRQAREAAVIEWRDTMRQMGAVLVTTLLDVLKKKSDGKRTRLTDAAVDNLAEFVRNYNLRDLANDADYQKHIETIRQVIQGVSAEKLRESENLQMLVANQLEEVKAALRPLVVESGRKFR